MKGLIFDIKRFAVHDGPGIRTTIFFKGCPLGCWWCHNPESRNPEPETVIRDQPVNGKIFHEKETVGEWMTLSRVMEEIRKERVFMETSDGGVTLSGGEPLLQHDFALELLAACKREGIHTALDTTGYTSKKILTGFLEKTDLFLYDLKHLDDAVHLKYTGVSNKTILENLRLLDKEEAQIILRFPVIPGINNDQDHLKELIGFLKKETPRIKRIDLLPYHNIAGHKYQKFNLPNRMKGVEEPGEKAVQDLKLTLEKEGFDVKTGG